MFTYGNIVFLFISVQLKCFSRCNVWLLSVTDQQLMIYACSAMTEHEQIVSCCMVTDDNHTYSIVGQGRKRTGRFLMKKFQHYTVLNGMFPGKSWKNAFKCLYESWLITVNSVLVMTDKIQRQHGNICCEGKVLPYLLPNAFGPELIPLYSPQ